MMMNDETNDTMDDEPILTDLEKFSSPTAIDRIRWDKVKESIFDVVNMADSDDALNQDVELKERCFVSF